MTTNDKTIRGVSAMSSNPTFAGTRVTRARRLALALLAATAVTAAAGALDGAVAAASLERPLRSSLCRTGTQPRAVAGSMPQECPTPEKGIAVSRAPDSDGSKSGASGGSGVSV
jgi:hypothetical protein